MLFFIALSIFATVFALAFSLMTGRERVNLQQRLSGRRGEVPLTAFDDRRPTQSLAQTVLGVVRRFLPSQILDRVQLDLVKAGNPTSLQKMILFWVVGIVVLPIIYTLIVLAQGSRASTTQYLLILAVPLFGFYGPRVWLQGKIKRRRKQILRSMPDAIDLITTSVEAGLGIDAAFARVSEKVKGPLAVEFRRILREMSLGRSRRESLQDFAERTDLEDVTLFVNAVIQAEHSGVSLGHVIRIQADQMRVRRKQRAEQAAFKAPVKMVVPLVLFIFPAMFIVILGPAVISFTINKTPG